MFLQVLQRFPENFLTTVIRDIHLVEQAKDIRSKLGQPQAVRGHAEVEAAPGGVAYALAGILDILRGLPWLAPVYKQELRRRQSGRQEDERQGRLRDCHPLESAGGIGS